MALTLRESTSVTERKQFIGPGRSVHEINAFLGQRLENLGNKLCNIAGHDPSVLAGRIEQLFGSSLRDRQLKLDILYEDVTQLPGLRQLCIKLLNFAWPSSSPETQCLTFEKIILLSTRYPGLRCLFCDHKPLSKTVGDDNWKRQDCEPGKEWEFYREFAAFCLQPNTLSGIVEKSKPSLLGRVEYDSLVASSGESSNLNLVPIEELLIFSHDGPGFNVSRLASIRIIAGILELPSFWDCKNRQNFDQVLKNIFRTILVLIVDADFDLNNDNPQETYPWMHASFDAIDAFMYSLIVGLAKLDPTKLRVLDIHELLKQLSRPESQNRFPNAVHVLNSESVIGYLLQFTTLADNPTPNPINLPYPATLPSVIDSLLLDSVRPESPDNVFGPQLEETTHFEASIEGFPNIHSLPRAYKRGGTDWFIAFNPQQTKILDMQLIHTFMHESVVCCVRFSADGKYLATGCKSTTHIYDVETGTELCVLEDKNASKVCNFYIRSVCFSPDSKYLATGAEDKQIRIWDIAERSIQYVFLGHQQWISSLDFSRDGRFIVSGSGDMTARIWDLSDGSVKRLSINPDSLNNSTVGATSVAISPNGQFIAIGSCDKVVRIWDASSGTLVEQFRGHKDSVYSVAFTLDGTGLISGSWDKTLKYWDISGLLLPGGIQARQGAVMADAVRSPVGREQYLKEDRGKASQCTMNFTGHKDYVLSVAVSHDGRWVVSGSRDWGVQFWDSATAMVQCMLQGHENSVISIDLSPRGNLLATGSGDRQARIWVYSSLK